MKSSTPPLSAKIGDTLPLVSITIPVLNEAENLDALYARLSSLADRMSSKCRMEFVFSDNHSEDETWTRLTEMAAVDDRVRALRLSRNFGFQRSILANYMHTRGDAVFQIDADLQDPPEMLEQFFDLWQRGYHVVYGIRQKRPEGWAMNTLRKAGYWFIDKIGEHPIPRDVGDFRLVDRKVISVLQKYRPSDPYLRGLIAGTGFKQTGIPYARDARTAGASKFRLGQLIRLGLTGVFNHSAVPLRIATYSGALLVGLSLFGALYYATMKIFFGVDFPRGVASIYILVLFGIGFQSLLLGILGEYLLRIYLIVRAEPVAIVEQALNFEPEEVHL